jgi:hypothetical protein
MAEEKEKAIEQGLEPKTQGAGINDELSEADFEKVSGGKGASRPDSGTDTCTCQC